MKARYGGDEDFVYIRHDALLKDAALFAPRGCDVNALLDGMREHISSEETLMPGWVEELMQKHTHRPPPKRRYIPAKVRRAVMERDAFACVHCGSADRPTLDHIRPFSRGGSHSPRNLRVLCQSCNSSKRDRTPEEWALWQKMRGC